MLHAAVLSLWCRPCRLLRTLHHAAVALLAFGARPALAQQAGLPNPETGWRNAVTTRFTKDLKLLP